MKTPTMMKRNRAVLGGYVRPRTKNYLHPHRVAQQFRRITGLIAGEPSKKLAIEYNVQDTANPGNDRIAHRALCHGPGDAG